MTIHFDYSAAEGATDRVSTIVEGMRQNMVNIENLRKALLQGFQGSGATGYEEITQTLGQKLNAYEQSLGSLNGQVIRTSVKGGDMDVKDGLIGNMFRNV